MLPSLCLIKLSFKIYTSAPISPYVLSNYLLQYIHQNTMYNKYTIFNFKFYVISIYIQIMTTVRRIKLPSEEKIIQNFKKQMLSRYVKQTCHTSDTCSFLCLRVFESSFFKLVNLKSCKQVICLLTMISCLFSIFFVLYNLLSVSFNFLFYIGDIKSVRLDKVKETLCVHYKPYRLAYVILTSCLFIDSDRTLTCPGYY